MQLKTINSKKIKTCFLFEYPENKQQLNNYNYDPLKIVQNKENYLLVDGYQKWRYCPQDKQECLVFPNSDFLKLWTTKLLDKFHNKKTNWIFLGELLQKMAEHQKISVTKLVTTSGLEQIIPNHDFLTIILEIFQRKKILQAILPQESWTMQNYKVFQKLNDAEIELVAKKFKKFNLNFNQYKQLLETLYDLKRLKKQSITSLLELILTDEQTSFAAFQKKLFKLRNPVASDLLQKRIIALQELKLPVGIKINYSESFESTDLHFYCQTKNIKDLKKLLIYFQNKLTYSHKQIEYLYKLL